MLVSWCATCAPSCNTLEALRPALASHTDACQDPGDLPAPISRHMRGQSLQSVSLGKGTGHLSHHKNPNRLFTHYIDSLTHKYELFRVRAETAHEHFSGCGFFRYWSMSVAKWTKNRHLRPDSELLLEPKHHAWMWSKRHVD